ncbi:hypothetical protein BDA99DRAFT_576094 [Phascolomyces articulosus]|uniref:F-box domain-containing protein n=1 Tax=Phascolomyces articulosus TaxID=60185 RepID=A0AAD5K2K5_9FUNG|nr:hypothetical protein BDA99DRAFT_576094 [Phascolomyces articulosus]
MIRGAFLRQATSCNMEQQHKPNTSSNNGTDNNNSRSSDIHSQSRNDTMTNVHHTPGTIVNNRNNSTNNKKNRRKKKNKKTMKRFDPIERLPFDVASKVFSHVNQRECLKVMGVSKLWRERVPLLTTSIWRTVELLGCFHDVENTLMHRVIGPHVNKLIFGHFHHEEELFAIMRIAHQRNCTQQTELWIGASQVINQEAFLKCLRPLVKNVTKLEFTRHDRNMAFLHVMTLCPKLQYFSFKTIEHNEPEDMYSQDPNFDVYQDMFPEDGAVFTNMTYLCLGATLHKHLRLAPILARCPNLRCLRVGSFEGNDEVPYLPEYERSSLITTGRYSDGLCHRDNYSTDINLFYKLCPKLQFLELNNSAPDDAEWDLYYNLTRPDSLSSTFATMSLMHTANFSLSLQLPPSDIIGQSMVAGAVVSSQAATTSINNTDSGGNSSDTNGLKLLYVHELFDYGPGEIIPEIKAHQATLEQLSLDVLMSRYKNYYSWARIADVHSETLREFSCKEIDCNGRAIASLIYQCPKLEVVEISSTGDNIHPSIITAISKLSSLKNLALYYEMFDIPRFIMDGAIYGLLRKFIRQGDASTLQCINTNAVDDKVLELITGISTLGSIKLVNSFNLISTNKKLLQFVSRLRKHLPDIYNLELSMFNLTPAIFDQIANLRELMFVNFCGSAMTNDGLTNFLDKVTPKLLLLQITGLDGEPQAMTLYDKYGNRKQFTIMQPTNFHF